MARTKWVKQPNFEQYHSHHITIEHYGEKVPMYTILLNPQIGRYVIGSFYAFTSEYTPFQPHLNFGTVEEAKKYIDSNYNK
ncbi:hypothetical protein P4493_05060 [Bacillus thuringiensis]|jgi:hypothetical protein|uniref:Uncharacterized protein n=3 Tax=Bacillus thuringiensis TaxID=1428 RepID=A0A0B5NJ55_BACTU|nr:MULTISPECIES: hypothetical protein [Bacillus]MEC2535605.1 hypothetical protein [Bacillus cereus]MED1153636.1 hypothetical protein [Bacillus paranthracis]OUB09480.1 hypothetical protein BK708_33740 [Bacillus thuringiensis serovar yunnanensis]AFQ29959.1 hypothetical protein BTF1_29292 [Bacillus thuringiensis HD-789]AJG73986.1 hypothetical protein BF38_5750 [Bacillus thuringiensis]